MTYLNALATDVHETSVLKGWWSTEHDRNPGLVLALVHSEVSEALEEWRNGHPLNQIYKKFDSTTKPEGVPIELADVIIRVLDACAAWDIDIDFAVAIKMKYNKTRPQRHGGKLA